MTTWLPVTKLDRAQVFYRDVLELPLIFESREMGMAEFQLGSPGARLALHEFDYLEHVPTNGGATIRLFVSDLKRAMEELAVKGVVFITDMRKQGGRISFCDFIDPDGNTLQLAECLDGAGGEALREC